MGRFDVTIDINVSNVSLKNLQLPNEFLKTQRKHKNLTQVNVFIRKLKYVLEGKN